MRLENIIALTSAKLLNKPFVSNFNSICYKVSSIKRGDLFIAKNSEDILQAIKNGAYGILFDFSTQIIDNEIAWIKVENIELALIKIIRFHLIEKDNLAYECDEIILELASQITTHKSIKILQNDIFNTFDLLWNIQEGILILFCNSFKYKEIFINTYCLPSLITSKIDIIEQTLFETSFIYNSIFYERKLLSPFFIPYLEQLLQLFKNERIEFLITSFHKTKHFEVVFVNNNFEEQEFGSSDKVLIFESSFKPIPLQIEFLKQQASWAKIIYIIPSKRKYIFQDMANLFTYNTQLDIINILKLKKFHFALIAEQSKNFLDENFLVQQSKQLILDLQE